MTVRRGAVPLSFLLLPLTLALGACEMAVGHFAGRATDEWTHKYPLASGGEISVSNTNGRIDVQAVDGSEVEVRAERIARGVTDAAARELLPRITIKEDIKPDRIAIETARMSGILFGAAYEVRYQVKAPKNALVNVTNTNGVIALNGLAGKVVAHTTNGGVRGTGLTGGVDASTTNGGVNIDLAAIGGDPISMRTTNGGVTVSLPETAKASVSASWTNGGINVSPDLKLDVSEKSRRHFEGRLNGGGTAIDLQTTNGGIRLRQRNGDLGETRGHGEK